MFPFSSLRQSQDKGCHTTGIPYPLKNKNAHAVKTAERITASL